MNLEEISARRGRSRRRALRVDTAAMIAPRTSSAVCFCIQSARLTSSKHRTCRGAAQPSVHRECAELTALASTVWFKR